MSSLENCLISTYIYCDFVLGFKCKKLGRYAKCNFNRENTNKNHVRARIVHIHVLVHVADLNLSIEYKNGYVCV